MPPHLEMRSIKLWCDRSVIDTVTKNLAMFLDNEIEPEKELKLLAETIQAGKIQDNSTMTQNNFGNARGWQIKAEGGMAYIGEIHIQQGQTPNS